MLYDSSLLWIELFFIFDTLLADSLAFTWYFRSLKWVNICIGLIYLVCTSHIRPVINATFLFGIRHEWQRQCMYVTHLNGKSNNIHTWMQPSNPNTILIHIQLTAQMLACLDEKGCRKKGGRGEWANSRDGLDIKIFSRGARTVSKKESALRVRIEWKRNYKGLKCFLPLPTKATNSKSPIFVYYLYDLNVIHIFLAKCQQVK